MDAAADRPEFAPPPERGLLRGYALAVLAHVLLVIGLTYGLHWQREVQDAGVEAELWSAVPQQAAPKEEPTPPAPPPPPPQPVVKAPPQPEPPVRSQADIALEREKQQRLEQERREREQEKRAKAEAQKKREQELARKKEREEELAKKKEREEELARKKELQQKQLAEARRKEEEKQRKQQEQEARDAKRVAQQREENLNRMRGMAGGTGAPDSVGTAARSSGPSASWGGKVQARVRPNLVFADNVPGNPQAIVEIRLGPGGMIVGKPRLVRSSGYPSWDEAVIRALERTESLPPDTDGRYPSPVEISFKPKA